jgi:myb proto-oncogene protein
LYALNCEQDKWRNINVTAIWGSRQKAKLALKKNLALPAPKTNNNQLAVSKVVQREDILDVKPLAVSRGTLQSPNSKEQVSRFENFQLNISAIYYQ